MSQCWWCHKDSAEHQVEEVWFDLGEPIMRFCSSIELYDKDTPHPCMCGDHHKLMAHALASTVLEHALKIGACGPVWPTRWWVKYTDGYVIGGDVGPKP